jgi:hypothetical protein
LQYVIPVSLISITDEDATAIFDNLLDTKISGIALTIEVAG